jgi:hypothetical protein
MEKKTTPGKGVGRIRMTVGGISKRGGKVIKEEEGQMMK